MLRIALTGGIATGKSYVLARLAASGTPTVDADALVHQALAAGSPVIGPIAARFGRSVVARDGSIDRKALGAIVFADAGARADLEALLHPRVYQMIDEWFASLRTSSPATPSFAVADIPLLFETGHQKFFDRVIVTTCLPALQLERLQARDAMSREDALQRLQAQWPVQDKVERADYVIDTGGSFDETDRQVDAVIDALARTTA